MAIKKDSMGLKLTKVKRKRPGVHSKTKFSRVKGSKNYQKAYNRQGR